MNKNKHPTERYNVKVSLISGKSKIGGATFSLSNTPTDCWLDLMFNTLEEKMRMIPGHVVRVLEISKCGY